MTPTNIPPSIGLRIASPMALTGGRGGAVGTFALPEPAAALGTGDVTGEAPSVGVRASDKSDKAKEADDRRSADEDGAHGAHKSETDSPDGGADGQQAGGGQHAGAQSQPLTIHTLNGLLLTLPATPAPGVRAAARAGSGAGAGGEQTAQSPGSDSGASTSKGSDQLGRATQNGGRGEPHATPSGSAPEASSEPSRGLPQAGAPSPERSTGPERGKPASVDRPEPVSAPSGVRAGVGGVVAPMTAAGESKATPSIGLNSVSGRDAAIGQVGGQRKAASGMRRGVPADRTGPAQVVRGVLAAVNQRGGKVTLDLQPGELGRMRVELKLDARSATAIFHVDSPQARRLLEEAMPQLRQALMERGVSLERAEVVAPSAELSGAMAAIQSGAQAIALVAPGPPQALDLGGDRRRSDADGARERSGDGERAGGRGEAEAESESGESVRMTIGPDGVDVMA